jgi:hypothetical protein
VPPSPPPIACRAVCAPEPGLHHASQSERLRQARHDGGPTPTPGRRSGAAWLHLPSGMVPTPSAPLLTQTLHWLCIQDAPKADTVAASQVMQDFARIDASCHRPWLPWLPNRDPLARCIDTHSRASMSNSSTSTLQPMARGLVRDSLSIFDDCHERAPEWRLPNPV